VDSDLEYVESLIEGNNLRVDRRLCLELKPLDLDNSFWTCYRSYAQFHPPCVL